MNLPKEYKFKQQAIFNLKFCKKKYFKKNFEQKLDKTKDVDYYINII